MDDLKKIKKYYGEKMMHLCRELFPTILETPGVLFRLLEEHFDHNKFLYDDIIEQHKIDDFKNYIYDLAVPKEEEKKQPTKSAKKLMREAGYTLYECVTEADIQSFRHFYKREDEIVPVYEEGEKPESYSGEELCTFNGGRLDGYHVFFAVKDSAENLNREDFKKPERQDEYGTSVISIQFSRGKVNTLSIKNRYNHGVPHPDATFSNDLDNIIPGLTEAFENDYGFNINSEHQTGLLLDGYVRAKDGKYYKYNFENMGIYFCPNNVVIEGHIAKHFDPSETLLIDSYLINFKEKKIQCSVLWDLSFITSIIESVEKIKKIEVLNQENGDKQIVINDDIIIEINNKNQIISYINPHITNINHEFMINNTTLRLLCLPKVKKVAADFLCNNTDLEELYMPNVEEIGDNFLIKNIKLKKIEFPKLTAINRNFMVESHVREAYLPNVKTIGQNCFECDTELEKIHIPNVETIGDCFAGLSKIKELSLPKVLVIKDWFLNENNDIERIEAPSVLSIGSFFMLHNNSLKSISLPQVKEIKSSFLVYSKVEDICLPNAKLIGDSFLSNNKEIKRLILPSAIEIGKCFLNNCPNIEEIHLPYAKILGSSFVSGARNIDIRSRIKKILLPNVKIIENNFMKHLEEVEEVYLPNVELIGDNFLAHQHKLRILEIPNVHRIGSRFIGDNNDSLERLLFPETFLDFELSRSYDIEEKFKDQIVRNNKDKEASI